MGETGEAKDIGDVGEETEALVGLATLAVGLGAATATETDGWIGGVRRSGRVVDGIVDVEVEADGTEAEAEADTGEAGLLTLLD